MRALTLAVAAALAVPAAPLPARAEAAPPAGLEARSRVDAVTVYRSSARVTRAARVELPAGDARVLLADLPDGLLDDSVRVEGTAGGRARVLGVDVERVTRAEARAAEARAAEERVESLAEEDRALEDRIRVAQGRQQFVESLRSTYSEERARNLAVRGVRSSEWADLSRFVGAELEGAAGERRRAEAARRGLARRLQEARAALEKLQAKRAETTKTVAVELSAGAAGPVELRVSYVVPAAGWEPAWDARLLPERGTVELALLGAVVNRTGEDWREVRLAVSTAEPRRTLFVPRLEPRWLQRREPVAARAFPAAPGRARAAEARADALAEAGTMAAPEPLEVAQASVQEGLLAATFTAPRRESVDGAGQARRIALQRFTLPAEVTRTAAPRLDPAAFLTARVVNGTGVPLLAGLAAVSVGDDFVGRAQLAATPPGGELRLAFGVDPRLEVERKVLERRHETAGIVSRDEVWVYRTRITVKNRWNAPVALRLLDLVPVSRDEAIEVKVLDGTTPAAEDAERPGVRVHDLTLAPRAEQAVEIRYRVRFPRGFPVAGLE